MADTDRRSIPFRYNDKAEERRAAAFVLAGSGLLISVGVGLLIAIVCVIAFAQGNDAQIIPMLDAADRPDAKITQGVPAQISAKQLPSISTIDAQTDITAFLRDNVPSELRLAALRRAWLMDPAIHDFKGLQEMDWNFVNAGGIPGFGDLDSEVDIARMVAQIIGAPTSCRTRSVIAYRFPIPASIFMRRTGKRACE